MRAALLAIGLLLSSVVALPAQAAPAEFQERIAFSGLNTPTNVEFSKDGRVFVAEKSGLIKVFDSLNDGTADVYADLRKEVYNLRDRGLLGMALHPNFPQDPRLYVLYTRDALPGGDTPKWGSATGTDDPCPTPPGETADGCVVTGRLSVLTPVNGVITEQPLITDWCQQFPTHSIGDLKFGPDGMLYASGGDGAHWNYADYGQDTSTSSDVTPDNPCGDPPVPVGTDQTRPTAEGGALRSQDLRTSADPTGLDGTIIKINPDTGAAAPGNPLTGPDANAARIISYGLRNPFRFTIRPGTNELWAGDVGWNTTEEINRIVPPAAAPVPNYGWPCYEGAVRQAGYDSLDLTLCESLYAQGAAAVVPPYFSYQHGAKASPADTCTVSGGSSVSGVAFYDTGNYPAAYQGALFFSDYSRNCVWVMPKGANGLPDPAQTTSFDTAASVPVELTTGPGGDLFAVNIGAGTVTRYVYTGTNNDPVAALKADRMTGGAPLTVHFDASASSDADLDPLTYEWDLDGDGDYDDSTAVTPTWTYPTKGSFTVKLRVKDGKGGQGDASTRIDVDNSAPTATITTPDAGLTWKVGDTISFSGTGTDPEQGTLPGSALTWTLVQMHCPSACHEHVVTTFTGNSGSFVAPDHEYPSHLELRLTVKDDAGLTDTKTVVLQPQTVDLTLQSSPPGLKLGWVSDQQVAPFTRTAIVNSVASIAAPSPQTLGGKTYEFVSWSDGGELAHTINAPATNTTYTATFKETTTQPPTGMVAAYAMNEGTGTTTADASGKNNTGTLVSATWADGKYSKAVSFDGTSSRVSVPDSPSLRLTTNMTLEAWVRPVAGQNIAHAVIIKQHDTGLAYSLYVNADLSPNVTIDTGTRIRLNGPTALPLNTWSHLAATYDGATLRLYVNGAQVSQTAATGTLRADANQLRIGNHWNHYFAGQIDEVRVYNRALSATEVQTDMSTPVGDSGPPPDTTPPTAPASLTATPGTGLAQLNWSAATDNVAVTGYRVHRSTSAGFTPSDANQIATTTATSYSDTGLAAGTYYYKVRAVDAAGNLGAASPEAGAVVTGSPPQGLVASYGLNDGTGTTVADSSGTGNTGTAVNTTWVDGKYGKALSFNGTSSRVDIADSPSLRLSTGMTLEAWIKPVAGPSTAHGVVLKQHANGVAYSIYANLDLAPNATIETDARKRLNGAPALPLDTWSHLAATYDGTTLRLYVNGNQVATMAVTGAMIADSGLLRLGGKDYTGHYFSGLIDEVRIYNKALTQAQIQADMSAPI